MDDDQNEQLDLTPLQSQTDELSLQSIASQRDPQSTEELNVASNAPLRMRPAADDSSLTGQDAQPPASENLSLPYAVLPSLGPYRPFQSVTVV